MCKRLLSVPVHFDILKSCVVVNVITLHGVCVLCVCERDALPLWGHSVFPATVHQSTLGCLGRRHLHLFFLSLPLSPPRSLSSRASIIPSASPSLLLFLTRSPLYSCHLPVNIYSPLCAGTEVVDSSQQRKQGCISQMLLSTQNMNDMLYYKHTVSPAHTLSLSLIHIYTQKRWEVKGRAGNSKQILNRRVTSALKAQVSLPLRRLEHIIL